MRGGITAQAETGAAFNVHPGRDADQPQEVMDFVKAEGGIPKRTIISHVDRTIFDQDRLFRLADTGCIIEFDLFGQASGFYALNPCIHMPNDAIRLRHIRSLIERGHLDFGRRCGPRPRHPNERAGKFRIAWPTGQRAGQRASLSPRHTHENRQCPQRGAPLMFGRNEKCGLRCVYHGWKFDTAGNVLDLPAESEGLCLPGTEWRPLGLSRRRSGEPAAFAKA
jgi:hypothetical protein